MLRRGALLVALLAAAPASALEFHILKEGLRLDITESLFSSYHGDLGGLVVTRELNGMDAAGNPIYRNLPENHFYDILNKLNATLAWRRFRLATRFDTGVFFDTPNGSCGPPATTPITLRSRFCQKYFYPEKLSLEYSGRSVEATLGDFYVSFGRGIILSLRKLDELGIDTTLLGGKFIFHEGNVGATLVAGVTNIQNIDEATGRFAADPYDVIAAGRVEYRLLDKVIVGLQESGGVQQNSSTAGPHLRKDGILMYGGTIDAPRLARWLGVYFEADGQMTTRNDVRDSGYAIYGAATGYFGPASVLVEVKHYSTFQRWKSSVDPSLPEFAPIAYNQPPTAERVVTELVAPIYDVTGPRLRVDYRTTPWLLVYASYGYFDDRGAGGLHYHDPYAGAEIRWNGGRSHLFPSGGYRLELCGDDAECAKENADGQFQSIGHVEWDATQWLPHGLSIEAQGQALFRRGDRVQNADGSVASWTEGDAYVALKWTPYLVFSGGYEWTTRPSTRLNQNYFNGAVQWNITTASSIRVFVGGTRGGLKCISGVCRDFPAFTGARLEVVVRL